MSDFDVVLDAIRNPRDGCHTFAEYTAGTCACQSLHRIERAVTALVNGWDGDKTMKWTPLFQAAQETLR